MKHFPETLMGRDQVLGRKGSALFFFTFNMAKGWYYNLFLASGMVVEVAKGRLGA